MQRGERERREKAEGPRALRASRPHTVGYIGGCDQEEGVVGDVPRLILADVRLPERGDSNSPWREAGPPNHLDDKVDSEQ